jgi:hypothetical protein
MPLHRRLPKRGFTNIFKKQWIEVSLEALDRSFDANTEITPEVLHKRGIIKKAKHDIVVLGNGHISKALKISAHRFTKSAREKIEKAGGAITVIEAVAVLPVPPLVEVTCTLLLLSPAVVPWTLIETVQLVLGARDAPLKLTDEEPAAAVAVPLQVVLRLFGVATTRPVGKLSVNATPVRVRFWLLLLSIVKVRLVVPFSGIVAAPKAFTMCGGLITVRFAEEVEFTPVPAAVELIVTLLL